DGRYGAACDVTAAVERLDARAGLDPQHVTQVMRLRPHDHDARRQLLDQHPVDALDPAAASRPRLLSVGGGARHGVWATAPRSPAAALAPGRTHAFRGSAALRRINSNSVHSPSTCSPTT